MLKIHEVESEIVDSNKFLELVDDFRKYGYLFLKNLFSKKFIENLNKYFLQEYGEYFEGKSNYFSTELSNKRYNITIDINGEFNNENLYANPLIISIIKELLTEQAIIGDIACVTSLPGARAQPIHRDGTIFDGNPLTRLLPPHSVGLLIPLIPFNEKNGTTRFWSGSHINNSATGDFEKDNTYFDAEIDIGSCILIDSRIAHMGNANMSDQIRPLLYINYSAMWYFDQNIYKTQKPLNIDDYNIEKVPNKFKPLFIRRNIYK